MRMKREMGQWSRWILLLIYICILLLTLFFWMPDKQAAEVEAAAAAAVTAVAAPTYVGGVIAHDTVWTAAGSPYIVVEDILVPAGVRLTIAAGVEVRFTRIDVAKPHTRRAVLRVRGFLEAEGTAHQPVVFTLEEGAAIGDWGGIWLDGEQSGALLSQVRILYAERGIYASGSGASLRLQDSQLSHNLTAVHLEGGMDHQVAYCEITHNEYGIYASEAAGVVEYNAINNNSWGIYNAASAGMHIRHNDIKSNTFGIVHDGGSESFISGNDFSIMRANDFALLVRSGHPAILAGNNFLFDDAVAREPGAVFWYIYNEGPDDVEAGGNWWDTVDTEVIAAYIYDKRDEPHLGLVNFLPIADSLLPGAGSGIYKLRLNILPVVPCSPNGDQVAEYCQVSFTVNKDALVTAEVVDVVGEVIRQLTPILAEPGVVQTFSWDGKGKVAVGGSGGSGGSDGGSGGGGGGSEGPLTVPDGRYMLRLVATATENGEVVEGEAELIVDCTPPELVWDEPPAAGVGHFAELMLAGKVRDEIAGPPDVHLSINDGEEMVLVTTPDSGGGTGNSGGADWHVFAERLFLPVGEWRIVVEAKDRAGNRMRQEISGEYRPLLTIGAPPLTNEKTLFVAGEISGPGIVLVEVILRDALGESFAGSVEIQAAPPPGGHPVTFSIPTPFTLAEGTNLVTAFGWDADGHLLGTSIATVVYDPYSGRSAKHTFPPGTTMISLPLQPDSPGGGDSLGGWDSADGGEISPVTALALPEGAAGYFDLASWQLVEGKRRYVRYSEEPHLLAPVQLGQGYWLKLEPAAFPAGHQVELVGTLADDRKPFLLSLQRGWNLIGCPYLAAVNWSEVLVMLPEGGEALPWAQAVAVGWVSPGLWGYQGGGYVMQDTCTPWYGYWVKSRLSLTLIIPPPVKAAAAGVGAEAVAATQRPTGLFSWLSALSSAIRTSTVSTVAPATSTALMPWKQELTPPSWKLNLRAEAGGFRDSDNYCGVVAGAVAGVEAVAVTDAGMEAGAETGAEAVLKAGVEAGLEAGAEAAITPASLWHWEEPPLFESGISLYFLTPDGAAMATDFRSAGAYPDQKYEWQVRVLAGSGEQVRLSWNWLDMHLLPQSVKLTMKDTATGAEWTLLPGGSYTYTPQTPGEIRHFVLTASSRPSQLFTDLQVYPNPWTGNGSIKLSLHMHSAAEVSAGIYDVSGRLRHRLYGRAAGSGRYIISWDGRQAAAAGGGGGADSMGSNAGKYLPNGLYQIKVVARAGEQVTVATERLVIWR
ncbi:MAG TPA: hypothetical protein GXX29_03815 [Firmicutes bacterium]|nr:hypothetical protein [Bacillota bacterium]